VQQTNEHNRERPTAAWETALECGACGSADARFSRAIGRRRFAVCRRCGIERLYDRLAESSLDLLYGSYYAAEDPSPLALEQQLGNPTFAYRRGRLAQYAGTRTRRILEIGCGDGNFLATLRREGWDVHGQDVSTATAAIVGRRHGIPVTPGALAAVASAPPVPVAAAYHVFEHIYDPSAWLQSVYQLIEPRGLLHLQVPNAASLTRRLSGGEWASMVFPQHVYFYEPRTLRALLERFGLTGRRSWSEAAVGGSGPSACASPRARSRVKAFVRSSLDQLSNVLARLEAAVGRGAVVDIVAQRE
jgi:SAM-dependent methyltransferase